MLKGVNLRVQSQVLIYKVEELEIIRTPTTKGEQKANVMTLC